MEDGSQDIKSLLVIRLGALGDVANTLPAVKALKDRLPGTRVGWLVEEPSRDLVVAAGVAEDVILFPRKRISPLLKRPWRWPEALRELSRLRAVLRARRYQCLLDFQGNLKSGLLGILSGVPDRVGFAQGYCREMNWLFNNVLAMPSSRRLPRAEKNAALAQALAPELELGPVVLSSSAAEAERVEQFLRTVQGTGPLAVLHPGTSVFGEFKRWPTERYGELAARLKEQTGARCIVTHGPGEQELAKAVTAASGGAAHMAPPLTLPGLIELLRRADLFIAGDTGPLHVAALLQRPLVAIFGPKDPAIYGPYGAPCEIVRAEVDCSPCARRTCNHARCVWGVSVDMVMAGAKRMLGI